MARTLQTGYAGSESGVLVNPDVDKTQRKRRKVRKKKQLYDRGSVRCRRRLVNYAPFFHTQYSGRQLGAIGITQWDSKLERFISHLNMNAVYDILKSLIDVRPVILGSRRPCGRRYHGDVLGVALLLRVIGVRSNRANIRNGDGRHDSNHGNNDQQLSQTEPGLP